MKTQRHLGFDSARTIKPSDARSTPVVWVRELRLLRELKADSEIIRTLTLKPGLNILWAKPADRSKTAILYEDGMSGHATGKTTFCRLLRYVLGEDNYGNTGLRDGVRQKFNNGGWVIAEVYVEGNPWVVGRPLGLGPHPFAIPGRTLERLFDDSVRPSFEDYRKAIEQAVLSPLPVKRFASTSEPITWSDVLPWLARDQECRYSDLDDWRNKMSESESPRSSGGERQYLMRAVLALVSEREQTEMESHSRLLAKNKQSDALLPKLQHQASIDVERLKFALGVELPDLGNELFYQAVTAELEKRVKVLEEEAVKLPSSNQVTDAQEKWRLDASKADAAKQLHEDVVQAIENHSKTIQLLKNEISPEGYQEYLASRPPAKGFCSVPLELARQSQCRLAYARHPELESPVRPDDSTDKIQSLARIIEGLSKEVPQKALLALAAADVARASHKQLAELQALQLRGIQEITKERQKLESIRGLAENARATWDNARKLEKEISVTTTEIEESLKRQEQIRKQHKKTMSRFSETYEHLIRAVLGNSLSAAAGFSGKSIALSVEYNGPLTSAAIETVKIIAFDIAAMLCSVEGAGFHPRFLIHDGPREADMSAEIYQKFFLFVREMEIAFEGNRKPNFQYIITTTEPPPEHLCTKPWLIETLDATDASKRLFKANL